MSKIYQYIWISGSIGGTYIFHRTLFVYYSKKMKKVQEHDLYLYQILHHFDLSFFSLGWIIKNVGKGAPLLFLHEVSIVVLVDIIAILLTPGIFLIQIVNTNMYLIHFHSKNIKMHFPKSFFFKFQSHYRHSLSIATRWNKLCWHQQRLHYSLLLRYLKKKDINNYNIYS